MQVVPLAAPEKKLDSSNSQYHFAVAALHVRIHGIGDIDVVVVYALVRIPFAIAFAFAVAVLVVVSLVVPTHFRSARVLHFDSDFFSFVVEQGFSLFQDPV